MEYWWIRADQEEDQLTIADTCGWMDVKLIVSLHDSVDDQRPLPSVLHVFSNLPTWPSYF